MTVQQPSQALPVFTTQNGTEVHDANHQVVKNVAAKGVEYFNPEQLSAPGLGLTGFIMLEAAAVQARGRITPEDSGI